MTAPQPAARDIVPADLLARLRSELEEALAARQEQLEQASDHDDVSFAFREINEKAVEEVIDKVGLERYLSEQMSGDDDEE